MNQFRALDSDHHEKMKKTFQSHTIDSESLLISASSRVPCSAAAHEENESIFLRVPAPPRSVRSLDGRQPDTKSDKALHCVSSFSYSMESCKKAEESVHPNRPRSTERISKLRSLLCCAFFCFCFFYSLAIAQVRFSDGKSGFWFKYSALICGTNTYRETN